MFLSSSGEGGEYVGWQGRPIFTVRPTPVNVAQLSNRLACTYSVASALCLSLHHCHYHSLSVFVMWCVRVHIVFMYVLYVFVVSHLVAVSYTHLDVYKRQVNHNT